MVTRSVCRVISPPLLFLVFTITFLLIIYALSWLGISLAYQFGSYKVQDEEKKRMKESQKIATAEIEKILIVLTYIRDMKQTRLLFIDRDGTLIQEPEDEQIDSFEKLVFTKGVFRNLAFIAQHTDYELVMVSNQDGLGTDSFPEDTFWPVHNFIIQTLESEGIHFAKQHIDRHFPEDNSPMRKPGTGMLTEYIDNPAYDMANSYVIGDRETDAQLAENLGCKSLILGKDGMDWDKIAEILFAGDRIAEVKRTTKETDIYIKVNLDGSGKCDISTGLGFFDHMLEQIGKHGMMDLTIHTKGRPLCG